MGRYVLTICLLITLSAFDRITRAQADCTDTLPSQLVVGETGRVTPGNANRLRELPSTSAAQIGSIPGGAVFEVTGPAVCAEGFTWANVRYDGVEGFTVEADDTDYFVLPEMPAEQPGPTPPSAADGCPPSQLFLSALGVTTSNVPSRLRDQPSTNGAEIGFVQPNDTFFVQDGPVCDGNFNWWQVEVDGRGGWLAEGSADDYFVEPLPATATPTITLTPLPTNTPTITPTPTPTVIAIEEVFSVDWSPDGSTLAVADSRLGVLLFDASNADLPIDVIAQMPDITHIEYHPDGDHLLIAQHIGDHTNPSDYAHVVWVWDIATDSAVYMLTADDISSELAAYVAATDDRWDRSFVEEAVLTGAAAWSPDGAYLLVGTDAGTFIYEDDARVIVARTEGTNTNSDAEIRPNSVQAVAFAPDANTFVVGVQSFAAYIYDIETVLTENDGVAPPFSANQSLDRDLESMPEGRGRGLFAPAYTSRPQALAFSPDGARVALGDDLGTIQMFVLATGKRSSRVRLLYDSDSNTVDTSAELWGVWDIEFAPDGNRFAVAEGGGSRVMPDAARFGDINGGRVGPEGGPSRGTVSVFSTVGVQLVNAANLNLGDLRSVAYSPDGARLAVSGTAGVVVLDAETLDVLATPAFSR